MQFIVPLVAALVPLLITPGLLSYFDITPKIAILLFGVALSLLYAKANFHNVRILLRAKAGRWFAGLLGAAWISSALATVFSTDRALSLNGGNWRRLGLIPETGLLVFALLAAAWLARDSQNIRTLLRASSASGALAAMYGIFQYFGLDPFLPVQAYQAGEGPFTIVRPPGTLGHADYFAAWLLFVTFFGVALARLEKARWRRIAAALASMLAVVAIVLSGTRSAILGLLAGALLLLLVARPRVSGRVVGLGIVCVAGSALFFFSPAGAKLRARVQWSQDDARGGARLLLWRDSLRMAVQRPLAGFGLETFGREFPRFESMELARAYPDFYHESPHNMFLDAFVQQGGLGLVALVGLCGLGVWLAWQTVRARLPLGAPLAATLAASLVAQQFVVFVFTTALYFCLLVAVLVGSVGGGAPPLSNPGGKPRLMLALAVVACLFFAAFGIRMVVVDRALAVAHQRIAFGDAQGAVDAYRTVLIWQPPSYGSDLDYSRAMQQLAVRTPNFAARLVAREQAIQAGVRATVSAEDRQNAWYHLAMLLATQNDAAGVERCLRNAIAWAPNWFKPHWALAQLLAQTNRRDEALVEARAAVERDGGRDAEVAETWKQLQQKAAEQP